MRERPHPQRTPVVDELPDPPHIETPVIQTQDLEYVAEPETRVSNKGVKITPTLEPASLEEQRAIADEDEDALLALEKIEKSLRGEMPG